jgi:hypothetical protein
MNAGVFTTLFIILVLIVVFFTVHEGFQEHEPVLHIPESPVKQKNLVEKSQEDYAPSYVLAPGPAPGAIASFNSLPYRDPSLEKAKYQRILNVQTTLEEFLRNEAINMEDLSDPSIQLPLTSARADLSKLKSEIMVLKRNPGIDSSLTQSDVDEIQANLAYLQKKYRLSIYNDTAEYEGFQSGSDPIVALSYMATDKLYNNVYEDVNRYNTTNNITDNSSLSYRFVRFLQPLISSNDKILEDGTILGGFDSYTNMYDVLRAIGISMPPPNSIILSSSNTVSGSNTNSGSNYISGSNTSNYIGSFFNVMSNMIVSSNTSNMIVSSNTSNVPIVTSSTITIAQLRDLINKIDLTKARLTMSGTTDPVVLSRVSVLDKIKGKVQDILNEVIAGARAESEIPITKDAYTNFLKTIADTNSPVNKLFGSNVSLADLLPAYSQGDANGAKLAQYLFTKYSDMLFKGMSFNMNFSYTSPAEQALADSVAKAITQNLLNQNMNGSASAKLLQAYDIHTSNNTFTAPMGSQTNGNNASIFTNLTNKYFGSNSARPSQLESPYTYSNNAAPFDWQERANFICESVQKRGLNPKDFGCLRPDEYVSENFSWRGYAKMICSRLDTSMDTGLPEICGCPPPTWPGWRP